MMTKIWCLKSRQSAVEDRKDAKISNYYQKQYYTNVTAWRKMYAWHGRIISKLLTVRLTAG
jgi:hypothetical protein